MDVKFTQSTDGGLTWSAPALVNDNVDSPGVPTDQFQPSVAAGPDGAVAVAFYDRRAPCPSDPSVLPADVGRTNFCIDTSLQAYKDTGSGAVPVGANVRISKFTWDPEQPGQHGRRDGQLPCADADCARRIHRRLLRPGGLGRQHLRAVRLDPLLLRRDRRRAADPSITSSRCSRPCHARTSAPDSEGSGILRVRRFAVEPADVAQRDDQLDADDGGERVTETLTGPGMGRPSCRRFGQRAAARADDLTFITRSGVTRRSAVTCRFCGLRLADLRTHDDGELEELKAAARQRLAAGRVGLRTD